MLAFLRAGVDVGADACAAGRFRHLQELFLNKNRITAIPMSLAEVRTLRLLSLSHNLISDFPPTFNKVWCMCQRCV